MRIDDGSLTDCPRCLSTCGWCGDYRFMHGKLRLPGSRLYCTLTEVSPEGADCPLCQGARQVWRTVSVSTRPTNTPTPAGSDHEERPNDR